MMPTDQRIGEGLRYLLGLQELVRAPETPGVGPFISGGGGSTPTIVVAASNTSYKTQLKADYVSPTEDTTETLQVALQDLWFLRNGGRIVFTEGDFYLPRMTNLIRGVRFEGMGIGATRLHSAYGFGISTPSNQTMFSVDHSAGVGGTEPISFSHLSLDGHKAIQTAGSPHGIYLEPNGGAVISLDNVSIHDFDGTGLVGDRCADTVYIDQCAFRSNTGDGISFSVEGDFFITNSDLSFNGARGIKADGANLKMVGCTIRSNGGHGFSAGGILESTPKILIGNEITGNGGYGIEWDGVNGVVADNYVASNVSDGIIVYGNSPLVIIDNTVASNTGAGITLTGGAGNLGGLCEGNAVRFNGQHGIFVNSDDWTVQGNHVTNNSRTTTNTYDGIHINAATDSAVLNNMVRQTAGAPVQRYGILVGVPAVGTWRAGNDCRGGGWGTADYGNGGTGTIDVWAGGTGDNQ